MHPPPRRGQDEEEPRPQLGLFSDAPAAPGPAAAPEPERAPPAEVRRRSRAASGSGGSLPAWAYAAMKPGGLETRQVATPAAEASGGARINEARMNEAREAERLTLLPALLDGTPATPTARPERRIWDVADLVGAVRAYMEDAWPDLWVHGEISNLRTAPSGHLYFTLKDGEAQLPAVLFRRQAQLLRFRPEDGLEVLLRGKVSVYEQRGQMQLIAEHLEPVGAGSLQIAFEQLKARLAAEGLFDADRKRALPAYPHCVGIITSPGGAVIRDFINVATRRHAALDVLLYPAVVQGASAAAEIAAGLAYFNQARNVDVIVVARGGGSLEDLAPFNTELLARAIAASPLPVVSAVGHETDFTIADFVADLRAPTPSAAAELITAAQHRVEEQVAELAQRLARACRYQLILAKQRLGALPAQTMQARLREALNRREQRVDTLRFRMDAALRTQLHAMRTRVTRHSVEAACARLRGTLGEQARRIDGLHYGLTSAYSAQLRTTRNRLQGATAALLREDPAQKLHALHGQWRALDTRLRRVAVEQLRARAQRRESLERRLEGLSPVAVLSRGYALVYTAQGQLLKRAADTNAGDLLNVRLGAGRLQARVEAGAQDAETNTGEA